MTGEDPGLDGDDGSALLPLRLSTSLVTHDHVHLAVAGQIDLANIGPLRESMTGLLHDPELRALTVDLAGVSFIGSTGIRVLVAAHRLALAMQVDFAVTNCRPRVLQVLEITGVDKALIYGAPPS